MSKKVAAVLLVAVATPACGERPAPEGEGVSAPVGDEG